MNSIYRNTNIGFIIGETCSVDLNFSTPKRACVRSYFSDCRHNCLFIVLFNKRSLLHFPGFVSPPNFLKLSNVVFASLLYFGLVASESSERPRRESILADVKKITDIAPNPNTLNIT